MPARAPSSRVSVGGAAAGEATRARARARARCAGGGATLGAAFGVNVFAAGHAEERPRVAPP